MNPVHVTDVQVLNNPASLSSPFQFDISFECHQAIAEDLEWKLVYVGSAEDPSKDQELDCVQVGPVSPGFMKFVFEARAPDFSQIDPKDLLEVTVILLSCAYRDQEFMRVGYYVRNYYSDPELQANPPDVPDISKIERNVLTTAPRVTRFVIRWDEPVGAGGVEGEVESGTDVNGENQIQEGELRAENVVQNSNSRDVVEVVQEEDSMDVPTQFS